MAPGATDDVLSGDEPADRPEHGDRPEGGDRAEDGGRPDGGRPEGGETPPVPADRPDLAWDDVPDLDDVHAAASDDLGEGAD
jgi:hypothetical protein